MGWTSARLRKAGAAVCLLALGAVLAGCGGTSKPKASSPDVTVSSTPASTSGSSTDDGAACKLVTQAEAQGVMGATLGDGVPSVEYDHARCTFTSPDGDVYSQFVVYLGAGAKRMLDIDLDFGNDYEPVSGIGDEAQTGQHAIHFRKGETWVGLHATTSREANMFDDQLVELARTVVGRV